MLMLSSAWLVCSGAGNRLSVYKDDSVPLLTNLPSYVSGSRTWSYSKCWGEPLVGRGYSDRLYPAMRHVKSCLDLAASQGYTTCGLEYGGEVSGFHDMPVEATELTQPSKCWCTRSRIWGGQVPESYCNSQYQ